MPCSCAVHVMPRAAGEIPAVKQQQRRGGTQRCQLDGDQTVLLLLRCRSGGRRRCSSRRSCSAALASATRPTSRTVSTPPGPTTVALLAVHFNFMQQRPGVLPEPGPGAWQQSGRRLVHGLVFSTEGAAHGRVARLRRHHPGAHEADLEHGAGGDGDGTVRDRAQAVQDHRRVAPGRASPPLAWLRVQPLCSRCCLLGACVLAAVCLLLQPSAMGSAPVRCTL